MATIERVTCDSCGADCIPDGCTTGYGNAPDGSRHCFDCCAERDRLDMVKPETRAVSHYLTVPSEFEPAKGSTLARKTHHPQRAKVNNWPGTLALPVLTCYRTSGAWGRWGWLVRVAGPDGFVWSGRNIGDHQIVNLRRTRDRHDLGTDPATFKISRATIVSLRAAGVEPLTTTAKAKE